ncbi:DUF2683 family protein [Aquirufa sp. PLAD-142S6K]|uniref:DUF2683 family protein n=2 Tax=Aquirufa echingensis TaxID=3096516 RepID=A0ABW6CYS7_9BACT
MKYKVHLSNNLNHYKMLAHKTKKTLHLIMKRRIQIFPKDKKQRLALTQWLRENNIPYEELDSKYDPAIVEKVLDGKRNIEEGNFIKFTPEMLWK